MTGPLGKILVIRGGAIGDFILTLPVLSALRENFPETRIEVLGYPRLSELALAAGIIDGYRSIEARALAGFFARKGKLDPELSEYFSSFALIFSYLYDPDEIFRTNIAQVSKAQYIQGPHRPDESQSHHATATFLQPLERLAIFDADPCPRLPIAIEAPPASPSGKWFAVHPGSGSEKKNWPAPKWIELVDLLLRQTSHEVLLIGGEAEGDRLLEMTRALGSPRVITAQNLPLLQLARVLRHAHFFLGHDSGITHIAAALGIPLLALWGPHSNDRIWRPPHPHAQILKTPSLPDLNVETLEQAALVLLKG